MRILLIHNFSRDTNGEDIYVLSLINLLKRNGHDVFAYFRNNKDIRDNILSKLKVAGGLLVNGATEDELSLIIRTHRIDIAHIHNVFPLITPVAYRVCSKYRIPIVQTVHNYRFICPKSFLFRDGRICELCVKKKYFYPSILYKCYNNSKLAAFVLSSAFFFHKMLSTVESIDKFIFPSEFTRDYYINNIKIPSNKTAVMPYFIDENKIRPSSKKKGSYFLFAGRFSEEKGIIPLLKIFSTLPQLRLVVLGEGPLKEKVSRYRKYSNISIKNFLPQKDVYGYMQKSIATIIPSLWYEVLPMVLIESLANSTPVIVPRFGTFNTLINEGETGIFFRYNDFNDLKAKITKVSRNRLLINKMRELAKEKYKKEYTASKHYSSLLHIYKNLVR